MTRKASTRVRKTHHDLGLGLNRGLLHDLLSFAQVRLRAGDGARRTPGQGLGPAHRNRHTTWLPSDFEDASYPEGTTSRRWWLGKVNQKPLPVLFSETPCSAQMRSPRASPARRQNVSKAMRYISCHWAVRFSGPPHGPIPDSTSATPTHGSYRSLIHTCSKFLTSRSCTDR